MLELSVNEFRGSIHPRGDRFLQKFELSDTATWHFEVNGVRVIKEVQILWQQNVTVIRYTVEPGKHSVEFSLLPFVSLRDFHALRQKGWVQFETGGGENLAWVRDGDTRLYLRCNQMQWKAEPDWWQGHVYRIESERGQDDTEDLFKPGMFVAKIDKPTTFTLIAATADIGEVNWDAELKHRPNRRAGFSPHGASLPKPAKRSPRTSPRRQRFYRRAARLTARRARPSSPAIHGSPTGAATR